MICLRVLPKKVFFESLFRQTVYLQQLAKTKVTIFVFKVPFLVFKVPFLVFKVPFLVFKVPFLVFKVPFLVFKVQKPIRNN